MELVVFGKSSRRHVIEDFACPKLKRDVGIWFKKHFKHFRVETKLSFLFFYRILMVGVKEIYTKFIKF